VKNRKTNLSLLNKHNLRCCANHGKCCIVDGCIPGAGSVSAPSNPVRLEKADLDEGEEEGEGVISFLYDSFSPAAKVACMHARDDAVGRSRGNAEHVSIAQMTSTIAFGAQRDVERSLGDDAICPRHHKDADLIITCTACIANKLSTAYAANSSPLYMHV
jgi:hypothetical protein